jgi:hypothetical protein
MLIKALTSFNEFGFLRQRPTYAIRAPHVDAKRPVRSANFVKIPKLAVGRAVLPGTVLLGTVLLGTVLLGTVLLGTVLLGAV